MKNNKKQKFDKIHRGKRNYANLLNLFLLNILSFVILTIVAVNKPPSPGYSPKDDKYKYILDWVYSVDYYCNVLPLPEYDDKVFVKRKCPNPNCIITTNKTLFGDITKFDAILFNGICLQETAVFPSARTQNQTYIFITVEPAAHLRNWKYDFKSFFNWSMTYKLNSDIRFNYFNIRDKRYKVIGPNKEMHWIDDKEMRRSNLDNSTKKKLQTKSKAVAWMVSNCISVGRREETAQRLQIELNKYGLTIDIFGSCGTFECPRDKLSKCFEMIQREYFFYLSFENSLCEDYVTEKLSMALAHLTVPVVYGGANYSMFVPNGSYLDARKLTAKELARQMYELIQDWEKYYQYFKWRNFYDIYYTEGYPDTDPYCRLCEMLHDNTLPSKKKVYDNFLEWWNGDQVKI